MSRLIIDGVRHWFGSTSSKQMAEHPFPGATISTDRPDYTFGQLEDDRGDLRVEIIPTRNVRPIEAAWLVGRLWNEQRFRLQLAWIMCLDNEPQRTLEVWADMQALAARVTDDPEGIFRLRELMNYARASWESGFTSEWHCEKLAEANETIRRFRFDCGPLPPNLQEVDYLVEISSYPVNAFEQLRTQLLRCFAEITKRAFELGVVADQLIHPPLTIRVFQFCAEPPPEIEGQPTIPVFAQGQDVRAERSGYYIRLPNQLCDPWPNTEWHREAEHCHSRFYQCTDQPIVRLPSLSTPDTDLSDWLDGLENCVRGNEPDGSVSSNDLAARYALTQRGVRAARSLSLTLRSDEMQIQAIGNAAYSTLAPRLFGLLVYLLNRHPNWTTTETLCASWSLISPRGNPKIQSGSVHAAINQLNRELSSTDLRINSITVAGYRIERIDPQSQQ